MKNVLVTTPDKWERLQKDLSRFDVCGFDVEAVGPARRYSQAKGNPFLNVKMSYLQGMSVAFENEACYYLPLRHKGPNGKWRWAEELCTTLGRFTDVWAHNVKFDSRMLTREGFHGDDLPWRDSMLAAWVMKSASRGVSLKVLAEEILCRESPKWEGSLIDKTGAEVLEYTCHDALNTLQVGQAVEGRLSKKQVDWLRRVEYPLAELLGRCEEEGVPLDVQMLEQTLGARATEDQDKLFEEWASIMGNVEEVPNVGSAKQLQALFEEGFWTSRGMSKRGEHLTGKDVLEWNEREGPVHGRRGARVCLDLRKALKAKGTYSDGFYEELRQWPDRRLHPEQNQMGTATTRLSSSNPNIQNQIAHGDYATLLRDCYKAPKGWSYVAADFSQQEPRIFADLASRLWQRKHDTRGKLYDLFMAGGDIHQANADTIGMDRERGKTWTMGFMMYGGSAFKASKEFGIPKEEAQAMIKANFAEFPEGPNFRDAVINKATNRTPVPWVQIASGHQRFIPELAPLRWMREHPEQYQAKVKAVCDKYNIDRNHTGRIQATILSSGQRKALNTVIQGGGAAMTKLAMVKFDATTAWHEMRIVFMTHDEITVLCREGAEDVTKKQLTRCMEQAAVDMGFTVPFVAKAKSGKCWSDLKENK